MTKEMTKEELTKYIKSIKARIASLEYDKNQKASKGCGSCDHGDCAMCAEQEYGEFIYMMKDLLSIKEAELEKLLF